MRTGSFLRQRLERVGDALLNLLPNVVTRSVDQARARGRHDQLVHQIDELTANLAALQEERTRLEEAESWRTLDALSSGDMRLPRNGGR